MLLVGSVYVRWMAQTMLGPTFGRILLYCLPSPLTDIVTVSFVFAMEHCWTNALRKGHLRPTRRQEKLRYRRIRQERRAPPWWKWLLLSTLFVGICLADGFHFRATRHVQSHYGPTRLQRGPISGRDLLFEDLQAQQDYLVEGFEYWPTERHGWESLPEFELPTSLRLELESSWIVQDFSEFMSKKYAAFYAGLERVDWDPEAASSEELGLEEPEADRSLPSFRFKTYGPGGSSALFDTTPRKILPSGIPDISDLFGTFAPKELILMQPTCYQGRSPVLPTESFVTIRSMLDGSTLKFTVCFDTGCTMASTCNLDDFEEPPVQGEFSLMKTVGGTVPITAAGIIRWFAEDSEGNVCVIRIPGYYIPQSDQRLLSPQQYASYHHWGNPEADCYAGNDKRFWMYVAGANGQLQRAEMSISVLDGLPHLTASSLPPSDMKIGDADATRPCPCTTCSSCSFSKALNLGLLHEQNENLTPAQKALLLDHQRLGHLHMEHLQDLYRPRKDKVSMNSIVSSEVPCCLPKRHAGIATCGIPMCMACQLAKAKRRPTGATHSRKDPSREHVLSAGQLEPGALVFMDHYESSLRGRLMSTRGREPKRLQYVGGTIFVDAATGLIKVYHQASLATVDTLRSKRTFEQEAAQCGIQVQKYHADNGTFTSKAFEDHLQDVNQGMDLCGVGAHHQNAIAERGIQTVHNSARAMMLHLAIHWPDQIRCPPLAFCSGLCGLALQPHASTA